MMVTITRYRLRMAVLTRHCRIGRMTAIVDVSLNISTLSSGWFLTGNLAPRRKSTSFNVRTGGS